MENYCGNCGNKLENQETKCSKCGFDNQSIPVKKVDEEKKYKRRGNIIAIIVSCIMVICLLLHISERFSELTIFFLDFFIVTYGRLAYSKNIFLRILFIIALGYIVYIILSILITLTFCIGLG